MEQVAIFSSDRSSVDLQDQINTWLSKMGQMIEITNKILKVGSNEKGFRVFVAIFYRVKG